MQSSDITTRKPGSDFDWLIFDNLECVVLEKIHTHPMEGHWKFLGGGGVLKVKLLEAMSENKLEFPGGVGCKTKKPSVGGVWVFFGTAQFKVICSKSFFSSQDSKTNVSEKKKV